MLHIGMLKEQLQKENVNAFLVYQNGEMIAEYYQPEEYSTNLAKINSITKSIMTTLIGIAIDKGYLPDIHLPIGNFFPHIPKEKENITIYHLLTMTTGEDWKEFENGVLFPSFFVKSKNWVDYILKRPLVCKPGTAMNYHSGSSHLLSYILQSAANMPAAKFAEEYLFKPLGIADYMWEQDPQGIYIGGFGMMMKPADLLKIGLLYLHGGIWQGSQLLSPHWVRQSTSPLFTTYRHIGSYGYHWWVIDKNTFQIPYHVYFAMGYGGQYIIVIPEMQLTAVISSCMPKRGLVPLKLFIESLAS
ncbi:MAG: serine hydrolase domain-containing protein [Ectobacillus sp.]